MNIQVSVIIPVYNVEPYISRCIESVLAQTYSGCEIILVDDGSPDECAQLCDEYGLRYKNIRVIHKQNGGLSSARNAGMRIAIGEYLFFIDSDDWIDKNCISDLVHIAEKERVDFVRSRAKYANWPNHPDGKVCDFGIETMMHTGKYNREAIEREILPICIATPQITFGPIVSAWGTLYKHSLLERNKIEFYEDIKYSEDCIFNARILMVASSFYYLNDPQYYHYFFNNTSITKSYRADRWQSNKNLIKRFEENFSHETRFDIPQQLWRKRLFCILNTLNERHNIKSLREKVQFCRDVCNDTLTKETMCHMEELLITWKLRAVLWMIKMRCSLILVLH